MKFFSPLFVYLTNFKGVQNKFKTGLQPVPLDSVINQEYVLIWLNIWNLLYAHQQYICQLWKSIFHNWKNVTSAAGENIDLLRFLYTKTSNFK